MANLKSRLDRLRSLGLVKAAELGQLRPQPQPQPQPQQQPQPQATGSMVRPEAIPGIGTAEADRRNGPPGWIQSGDFVWMRETRHPLWFPEGLDLAPFEVAQNRAIRCRSHEPLKDSSPLSMPGRRENLRFFDLETTGLSGGTGTVAFLAAIAVPDADGCAVRQFFLSDYPGEPAFLESIIAALPEGVTIITYNGRSFDIPLLRTRCIMNGMKMGTIGHLDALYLARRLWKRIHGGASLGRLEACVLGVERELDVPGSRIPGLWLEYLRSGNDQSLEPVFLHNAIDVVTLAGLTARASRMFTEPEKTLSSASGSTAADAAWIGRTLIELGDARRGEPILESACAEGDENAGLFLLSRYRRAGRREARAAILDLLPVSPRSDIERAKYAEHVIGDFQSAIYFTERAMSAEGAARIAESLAMRHRRLSAKMRFYAHGEAKHEAEKPF